MDPGTRSEVLHTFDAVFAVCHITLGGYEEAWSGDGGNVPLVLSLFIIHCIFESATMSSPTTANDGDTIAGAQLTRDEDSSNSGPSELCDAEKFCKGCVKLVVSTTEARVPIHDSLSDLVECGKTRCPLCRYFCTLLGEEVVEDGLSRKETFPVKIHILKVEGDNGCGQKLKARLIISKDDWEAWHVYWEAWHVYWEAWHEFRKFLMWKNDARGLNRGIWCHPGPVLDFKARQSTLVEWLGECRKTHPKCRNTLEADSPMAARILELRTELGETRIRLLPTKDLDLHRIPYFVLSHCWGGVEIEAKLTRDKLDRYLEDIPISTLPKTFKEMVEITQALRCRYLWIDSLCIIQHDADDWNQESAKMASIFRGATLTISASGAQNSTQGCGIHNPLKAAVQFTTARDHKTFFSVRNDFNQSNSEFDFPHDMIASPVHTRAWIFQEKVLSRRILHATQSQFAWQCATHIESETGWSYHMNPPWHTLGSHVKEYLLKLDGQTQNIRTRWWHWVREYMNRNLTNTDDHYGAFAGITDFYRNLTGDVSVFGLWKRDLHLHLGWRASIHNRKWSPLEKPRVPSWTWLTYPHGSVEIYTSVSFGSIEGYEGTAPLDLLYEAEVLNIETKWEDETNPLVSAPAYGCLTLRGLLDQGKPLPKNRYHVISCLDPDSDVDLDGGYDRFALFAHEIENGTVFCPRVLIVTSLVLKATDVEGEYRRIGEFEQSITMFLGTKAEESFPGEWRTIRLV
ncbi:HET-domain-containing protein [Byssothecium circinans]|uniref:HET-domain-containing protein n=1 Tax=Byssothecium circinans TaxID=147558 RepID=A0A6A5TSD8_9PLEO|nr:HET-domain-containing protein [Byssothecium circinans]